MLLVVLLAKMTIGPRTGFALLALFLAQAVLSGLQPGGQATLVQSIIAWVYIMSTLTILLRDRGRIQRLLTLVPPLSLNTIISRRH
jgi:hypothetical protein